MTRYQQQIRDAWHDVVLSAMRCQDADAVYRLTVAFVRRLRELGYTL